MKRTQEGGQSLIELVVGVAVGILFIVAAVGIITLTLKVDFSNTTGQAGNELATELANNVESLANGDWHNIDSLTLNSSYYLGISGSFFNVVVGQELIDSIYLRDFTVAAVSRDDITNQIVSSGGTLDPSTFLITVTVSWNNSGDIESIVIKRYLSRNRDRVFHQSDWSGGSGQEGPITIPNSLFTTSTNASATTAITISGLTIVPDPSVNTNIDLVDKWAWNDVFGWMNLNSTNTVVVSSSGISGYASSTNIGYIAFDCATTPSGDICGTSSFGISNDGAGILSGFAWNDIIGWISFAGTSPSYGVTIDSNGYFNGFAWNDSVGWISFNCANTSQCGQSDYKTRTFWNAPPDQATLTSSVFDTARIGGAGFNNIIWQGVKPNGTGVKFQIATSNNAAGPWLDLNYWGPDGTNNTYYQPASWGSQEKILPANHNNQQYIRYRVFLDSDENHTVSPSVEDIIINWSY